MIGLVVVASVVLTIWWIYPAIVKQRGDRGYKVNASNSVRVAPGTYRGSRRTKRAGRGQKSLKRGSMSIKKSASYQTNRTTAWYERKTPTQLGGREIKARGLRRDNP